MQQNSADEFFVGANRISIPQTTKIVFVADLFIDDYVGGAELTSQALIESSPFEIFKLKSKDVTVDLLKQGHSCFWIFGNFAELNPQLFPTIIANMQYACVEYDYKFCRYRSVEKHQEIERKQCDCQGQLSGKMVSAFFCGAKGLFWMSEGQKDRYLELFPFLADKDNLVLSSVFTPETLQKLAALRNARRKGDIVPQKWTVLGSNSWIKGFAAAQDWCTQNNKEYQVLWNLSYDEMLARLASSEGLVYLPPGSDTCPRMVIEAKLLGCELVLNDNVQHRNEEWFNTDNVEDIESYLYATPKVFWNHIRSFMDYRPTVSGYTTTLNCVSQTYPFEESILSMMQFCDEICVVDGGSTDGTWEKLTSWALLDSKLKVKQVKRDWNHPRSAVFDGMQKAEARRMCTKEFCWQMDSDEVVHEDDATKITDMCRKIPNNLDVISLPVIEFWGGSDKVRIDVMPWKWRLSRNKPHITHGIPVNLRALDSDGNTYSLPGSDGCDMIHAVTGEPIPHASFYTQEVHNARLAALSNDGNAISQYTDWFNQVTAQLPSVFHYSWFNLKRKIELYKNYWTRHWAVLSGGEYADSPEQNMMFDESWANVTDEMISSRANELGSIGGWIWHKKWNYEYVPWMTTSRSHPVWVKNYVQTNEKS